MLSYEFVILEVNGTSCEFALDDIYWEGGITGVNEEDSNIYPISGFILQDNYPNPFKSETKITYAIPETAHVEMTVHDITGRIIKTLVNEIQCAGSHSVNWTVDDELSGLYFYRIKAGSFNGVKKCSLHR